MGPWRISGISSGLMGAARADHPVEFIFLLVLREIVNHFKVKRF